MKSGRRFFTIITAIIAFVISSCGKGNADPYAPDSGNKTPGTSDTPEGNKETVFAKGADISWVTEMEAEGVKFHNAAGEQKDCFVLMKELGMNAIRLRVWVNPEKTYGNWSNQTDVVAKAKRAKEAGLDVMIDFHYSDFFADPGKQTKPEAWKSKSFEDLKAAVASHTSSVLKAIKAAGVEPKWIQIGNETRNGMLWSDGQLWTNSGDIKNGWQNYAALSNLGYDAAKAVFKDAIIIVHQNNAWENLNWWFTKFSNAGGKFDMIGLSHYPQAEIDKTWQTVNTLALNNIASLGREFNCGIMICEIGVKTHINETEAAKALQEFMTSAKKIDCCSGVFYWEPQANGSWKPKYYKTLNWNAYDMGAFTADWKPSSVLKAFSN